MFLLFFISYSLMGQDVPILDYTVNPYGQVRIEIAAESDKYYILSATHEPDQQYESNTSMTLGIDGNMIITEPLGAFPQSEYKVTAYSINSPEDIDGDGKDDITEFNDLPTSSPFNYAREIPFNDGTAGIPDSDTYTTLGVIQSDIPWAPFLNNQEFVKFAIVNQNSDEAEVFFINSKTHNIHNDFLATIGLDLYVDDVTTGEIVYNPNAVSPNGTLGVYSFNYSFGNAKDFKITQRTFELLGANMPFLRNNLQHFIGAGGENAFNTLFKDDFEGSRINVILESDVLADIDFIPFHNAEGYGFFRQMGLDENPGSRDIVLYDVLPNSLPRVGGIITSVSQTPLSHVNLRAIQDDVPNAYIKNPLEIEAISSLIGKYIYYKVTSDNYEIREATLEEVNNWYEKLRPTEDQTPDRDLSKTEILPLDEITFDMSTAFGAKCSNVATMRRFGFPEGTIPNGFGVPFYFYDEFMKFNNFYERVEVMVADPTFITDLETRVETLKDFRKDIKDAEMPEWMLDALQEMHDSFPEGTSVRCRSSTNNEDLPGFSGAGLYTSKTQHPEEGHIKKSIKQVYASMWNFRAFEERDFSRINQYVAAMGVLCHPNYKDEKSNGVGVSLDPIYATENAYYLNTQVGESLITNPDANTVPEEIILYKNPVQGYFVLRNSNLVADGELVMGEEYLSQMREYMKVIHDEFAELYDVVGAEGFGMDIEYKVTVDDRLIIKQARPWVSFWAEINSKYDLGVTAIKAPVSSSDLTDSELVTVEIANAGLEDMYGFDLSLSINNEEKEVLTIMDTLSSQTKGEYQFTIPQDFAENGDYNVDIVVSHPEDGFSANDTLRSIITSLFPYDASLTASLEDKLCAGQVEVKATIFNNGANDITKAEIEVVVNNVVVDIIDENITIESLTENDFTFIISEGLDLGDNDVTLNLLRVDNQVDGVSDNNSSSINVNLDDNLNLVKLNFKTDFTAFENNWELVDNQTGDVIARDTLSLNNHLYEYDICIDYNKCYTLKVYDVFLGNGICCNFGEGFFNITTSDGTILVENDGMFESLAVEEFCANDVINSTSEVESAEIKVFPNPTDGIFVIEIEDAQNLNDYLNLEVYNSIGAIVKEGRFVKSANNQQAQVSLDNLPTGNYFVRCFNLGYNEIVKIVKL